MGTPLCAKNLEKKKLSVDAIHVVLCHCTIIFFFLQIKKICLVYILVISYLLVVKSHIGRGYLPSRGSAPSARQTVAADPGGGAGDPKLHKGEKTLQACSRKHRILVFSLVQ